MKPGAITPRVVDPDPDRLLQQALATAPGFVPEWTASDGDPGRAVAKAFAQFEGTLGGRLNQAPDKNKLAFYDLLGLALLPPAAAKVPVVFEPISVPVPEAANSTVPAGSRVGADGEGQNPIVFVTEDPITVVGAALAEVRSVWPGRDAVADHSERAIRGQDFTWFDSLEPVAHEFYLGHDHVLRMKGQGVVEVRFEIERPLDEPLDWIWEYWDGEVWREFKKFKSPETAAPNESADGTRGLTRSGVVRLVSDCFDSVRRRVYVEATYWIRARLDGPYAVPLGGALAEVDRVSLTSRIDRTLPSGACATIAEDEGLILEHAYAETTELDLSKSIKPMGETPRIGDAFYIGSDEIFGRPGAEVTICFTKLVTPEEVADEAAALFAADVNNTQTRLINSARAAANAVLDLIDAPTKIGISLGGLQPMKDDIIAARNDLETLGLRGVQPLHDAVQQLVMNFNDPSWVHGIIVHLVNLAGSVWTWLWGWLLYWIAPGVFQQDETLDEWVKRNETKIFKAFTRMHGVAKQAQRILDQLAFDDPTPYLPAIGVGAVVPEMDDAVLSWEYWNGRRWRSLSVDGTAPARRLRGEGPVTFTVPGDIRPFEHAGVEAHWIRARLIEGGYGVVRIVSFRDENSGKINFFPIIEHRPPVLDRVRAGYSYVAAPVAPQASFAFNDYRFKDHTHAASVPGIAFTPFEPIEDPTPSMYFGFDGALPAGALGLFLNVGEVIGEPEGPELVWDHWDGTSWAPLTVDDGTRGMALPGLVRITYPGNSPPPSAHVLQTAARAITLLRPEDGIRFTVGDLVYVRNDDGGELAMIARIEARTIELTAELEADYSGGTMAVATLPRFGVPRTWIRGRLVQDLKPRRSHVASLHANAGWATQLENVADEVLGSSSGEPEQVFFVRRAPVVGNVQLEVRELQGPRAEIERTLLLEELRADGLTESDVRETRDRASGDVDGIWVRWQPRESEQFVRPGAREYVLERSRGRVLFSGRVPPPGRDNILARRYNTGSGREGNVRSGEVKNLLSGALVQSVKSVRAAEGASDGERATAVLARGPTVIRTRRQAISRADYEALAKEASPAVAVARALPATHPSGRHAPGWVTIQVVPHSEDPQPYPTFGLRELVQTYLRARVPVAAQTRVHVVPADFWEVGARVRVAASAESDPAVVVRAIEVALHAFFHPLTGGPDGCGWPFGRDVHVSDAAAVVGRVESVERIPSLTLIRAGTPVGNHVDVPRDRLVAAGGIHVFLAGA